MKPIRAGRWTVEVYGRALHLTREPHPNCPDCNGSRGGWIGSNTFADWDECACLDQIRTWRLPLWFRGQRQQIEEPF